MLFRETRVTDASHEWAQLRSLHVNDPNGNVVEWVCFDRVGVSHEPQGRVQQIAQ